MSPRMATADAPTRGRTWPSTARLAVAVVALLALANLLTQVSWGLDAPPKTDYLAFATGARLLHDDPSCLYCDGRQAATQAAILGYVPTAGFPKPYVNPPLVAELLRPLSGLSLRTGLLVLMLVLLVALAVALRLFDRLLPHEWPSPQRLLLGTAAVVSLPAATAVGLAQWAPLLLLAALGALAALRGGRPVLAGVLLSMLLIKPQTVWLVLPALAVAGAWRVLAGFALGGAGWLLSSIALVGWDQVVALPRLILDRHIDEAYRTSGLPGIVTAITGSGRSAFVAALVLAAVVIVALVLGRRRLHGRADLAIGLGIAASLVCAPHVFPDDLMLLAVTAVVWAPAAPRAAVTGLLGLSVAYQLDGWLPSSLAHLTALAALGVAIGAALSLRASVEARRGGAAVLSGVGVESAALAP